MPLWSRSRPATAGSAQPNGLDDTSDQALVAAARADPAAFGPLYERYLGPVYRYCYLRLGTGPAAEDATGEVFLKALAGLGGYRGGSFAAWLFRIAHNVVVDLQRAGQAGVPLATADDRADPALTPEELVVWRAEGAALRAALARLPDDQRAALELQLAGWSGEQIGAALRRSPAAVKMLRFRALARLRRLLADEVPSAGRETSHDRP